MSDKDQFKEFYLHSARNHLRVFNEALLKLEGDSNNKEVLEDLMHHTHAFKAESAGMGMKNLEHLGHAVESVFANFGQNKAVLTKEITDSLYQAIDFIEKSLNNIESGDGNDFDSNEMIKQLKKAAILESTGSVKHLTVSGGQTTDTAQETEQVHSITLSVEKIDHLVKMGEELAIVRFGILSNPLSQSNQGLKEWAEHLDKITSDLQSYIMRISLFPISLALYTIPRVVRDAAEATGKMVKLEIRGETVTVDRLIIHHLTELLVHLLRNSIDHGIESPNQRRQQGKVEEGMIILNIYIKDKHLYVEVIDDGGGIDWEALGQKANEHGFFTTEEISNFTDEEKTSKLLFSNQLSTSEAVSEISGRGIGLGAVSIAVQKLDGSLKVTSQKGKGTTFTLILPIALEVIEAMMVRIDGRLYALPSEYVTKVMEIDLDDIMLTKTGPYLDVEGERAMVYDLVSLLKIEGSAVSKLSSSKLNIVLLRQANRLLALMVDSVGGKEEIVVKPLESSLVQGRYLMGLTVLDNGMVVPIIKVSSL